MYIIGIIILCRVLFTLFCDLIGSLAGIYFGIYPAGFSGGMIYIKSIQTQVGVEPKTFQSQVQHSTTKPN